MYSVYKYEITDSSSGVYMPEGASVLKIGAQYEKICVWALVDLNTLKGPEIKRNFKAFGTGHPIKEVENLVYYDTVMLAGGQLVFHIFEEVYSKEQRQLGRLKL